MQDPTLQAEFASLQEALESTILETDPETPTRRAELGALEVELRAAQEAPARLPEFAGTVSFVPTGDFGRPAEDSPNRGHGHHWFGNAESYLLIGDAMGLAMRELLEDD